MSTKPPKDNQYDEEETKRRAEAALRGAFKTPPLNDDAQKSPNKSAGKKRK